ncbi:MAG: phosphoribosyltransferase family protein [Bacillota bacterium]|nr:phosphoribosyltransferase family protein [Bacillota bacterium]MDW7678399.1 phosphoribosyltransferase family protein [Bacillota bacterium]
MANKQQEKLPLFSFAAAFLDYLYPSLHDCPQCGAEDIPVMQETAGLCNLCFATFPWMDAADLPAGVSVPARYESSARALIFHLKYRECQYLSPMMAWLMADCFRARHVERFPGQKPGEASWLVIHVPLHHTRQKQRGYNQSHLLAKHTAGFLDVSYEPQALIRHRKTAPLYRLSRQERMQNVAGSISLNRAMEKKIRDSHILLVDDIYTTGATASACKEALLQAGPASITVMAFALADIRDHNTP